MDVGLPLTQFWTQRILCGTATSKVYEVSRTEPFRLLGVRTTREDAPATALIGRTVKTVVSFLEPTQPELVEAFHDCLRLVLHEGGPVHLQYYAQRYGAKRLATIIDEGPEHPYLTVYCREDTLDG